jgi:hypothetical protein
VARRRGRSINTISSDFMIIYIIEKITAMIKEATPKSLLKLFRIFRYNSKYLIRNVTIPLLFQLRKANEIEISNKSEVISLI